ncbi:hypothetical protein BSLG_003237 [Batrachochytrium salamandrivorans]|nr:hypothetical protein BSLG_003237 [Batrachochytrium salamandrivorans]
MSCKVIQAADVAAAFVTEIKASIVATNAKPLLVGFLANNDPAARMYAQWTAKTCQQTGIAFELRECPRTELEDSIVAANEDENVHGIMVYYPVFGGAQDQYIQNTVSHTKDVEGLCHKYRYNMYHNIRFLDKSEQQKCIIPCTPLAVVKILEYIGAYNPILPYGNRLHGRIITIINRSEVVGRPLACLLANDGAKVYSVDENGIMEFHRARVFETTVTLSEALSKSDVVVTGVPSANYKLDTLLLKDGVIAINFSTFKNIDLEKVKEKASIFVPSIGKVTVSMLERNLLRLYEYQTSK